jgi:3-deoxy-D-manno-octulosonic-acid transferase
VNRLFFAFYEVALWVIAFLATPQALYQLIFQKKYRQSLMPRLGLTPQSIEKNQKPSIWIHAVSVGETKAVVSLARHLKQRFPHYSLIISSITETGHAEALRSLPFADHHIYLPYDFRCLMKRAISQAKPRLIVLCESDFWLNFLNCAKNQGAALVLVNGKISERSTQRFHSFPFFAHRLFGLFDLLCVQNPLYQTRLEKAGASLQQLAVTGNLKLDEEYPHLSEEEVAEWRCKLGIKPCQTVLTIGSTHYPEEEKIIEILKNIWKVTPDLLVIIVPRHPERFKEVAHVLKNHHITFVKFTELNQNQDENHRVILMDAMGLLRLCYQLADIAIVGGSFTDQVGGHNILEPCWYGKPVLFGPYMHSQLELVGLMRCYQAGKQTTIENLENHLIQWIENCSERQVMGERGLELVCNLKGSTHRTLNRLNPLLKMFEASEEVVEEEKVLIYQS